MKYLRILTMLLLLTSIHFACNNPSSPPATAEESAPVDEQMLIDTFSNVPLEVNNCSCLLSNTQDEFSQQKYVYADDHASTAFMKIKGIMETLKLNSRDTMTNRNIKVYGNDNYQVTVELNPLTSDTKSTPVTGTLTIIRSDRKEVVINVTGTCGCK